MSQEDTMRLAAEIVDKFSGPLREMTKGVHQFQDMLKGAHTEGSKGAKEQAKQQKELNEKFVETGRTLVGIVSPAMAGFSLTAVGVAESVKGLFENLRSASEGFYKLQGAVLRTGMAVPTLEPLARTISKISGTSLESANDQLGRLGDTAAKLARGFSPEFQRLEGTFSGLEKLTAKMAGEGGEAAAKDFWKFYSETKMTVDQRRTLLSAYGFDPNVANASVEQFQELWEAQRKRFAEHPLIDMAALEKLHTAFEHLDDAVDDIGNDLVVAFGPGSVGLIDHVSGSIKGLGKELIAVKQVWDAMPTWMGGGGKAVPGSPFQPLPPEGLPPPAPGQYRLVPPSWTDKFSPAGKLAAGMSPISFTTGADESAGSRMVHIGTLAALQEWYSSLSGGGGGAMGGGGGIVKASLGGFGGGGMPKFGSAAFPNLGGGGGNLPGGGPKPLPGGAGNSAGGGGGDGSGGDPSLSGSAYLQSERARYGKEFADNPALKKRMAAIIDLENPKAGTAVGESLMNRMNLVHRSLASGMAGGPHSFYGPARHPGMVEARMRELEAHPNRLAARMRNIDEALAGSNFTKGYTDQGSAGDPNYERGGVGVNINRERFNDWGVAGARAYRENQQAQVLKGGPRDLLSNSAAAGMSGGAHKIANGNAHLEVAFRNAPAGVQAYMKYGGLFKTGKVDWGHAMPSSDPGGGS